MDLKSDVGSVTNLPHCDVNFEKSKKTLDYLTVSLPVCMFHSSHPSPLSILPHSPSTPSLPTFLRTTSLPPSPPSPPLLQGMESPPLVEYKAERGLQEVLCKIDGSYRTLDEMATRIHKALTLVIILIPHHSSQVSSLLSLSTPIPPLPPSPRIPPPGW